MSTFKKVVAALVAVLIFSISGAGQAQADQTINIDLDNFQPDVTYFWPIQTYDGFVAGEEMDHFGETIGDNEDGVEGGGYGKIYDKV